jgi:hypothetical protein
VGGRRMEEGVKEGEYGGNITYSYMKMEKLRTVESIIRMGGLGIMENDGWRE